MTAPRRFYLYRKEDESGVSGTGYVAVGAVLPTGRVAMEWLVDPYTFTIHQSMAALEYVHGHGGKTVVEWIDEE